MSDNRDNLIRNPSESIGRSKNALTRLWRIILRDANIDAFKWHNNMERYLNDPVNGIPDTKVDRANKRGNLTKDLTSDALTWRAFMECMRWLNPLSVKFTAEIRWRSRRVTTHTVTLVDKGNMGELIDERKDDE